LIFFGKIKIYTGLWISEYGGGRVWRKNKEQKEGCGGKIRSKTGFSIQCTREKESIK
jgi:hypothetical protein